MSEANAGHRLVADVGGTNTRIALFDERAGLFKHLQTYRNSDFARLEDLVQDWLALLTDVPEKGCIAIAASLGGDQVDMVNRDWHFSRDAFARATGIRQLDWINDFVANAHALPYLTASDQLLLHAGGKPASAKRAVFGPGTGLGGATLEPVGDGWLACPCEPGHAGLAPGNALELELFSWLLARYDSIYTELLVSGPGLQRLHRALADIHGTAFDELSPEQISQRGMADEDPLCRLSLDLFCDLLGSACGDFLVCSGALGGVHLGGGILPQIAPILENSGFHSRLCHKGAMGGVLQQVPVYLITREHPGLLGAAHAPLAS